MFTLRKRIILLACMCAASFMVSLDVSVVNIAYPYLSKVFNVTIESISSLAIFYLLSLCSMLIIFGKISDLVGASKVFLIGSLLFSITSLLCAVSGTFYFMLLGRFLQGIASSMISATTGALIFQRLPKEYIGRSFAAVTGLGGIGFAFGPPIGSFLIEKFGWHSIFLINVPIGFLIFFFAYLSLSKAEETRPKSKIDFFDLFLIFFIIFFLICILILHRVIYDFNLLLLPWIVWFLLLIFFIYYEKGKKNAVVDFLVFKNKNISLALISSLLIVSLFDGFNFIIPFYAIGAMGFSQELTGFLIGLASLIIIFTVPLIGFLSDRFGHRKVCIISSLSVFISSFLFFFIERFDFIFYFVIAIVFAGIGVVGFFIASPSLILGHVKKAQSGFVSSFIQVVQNLGAIIGIYIFSDFYGKIDIDVAKNLLETGFHNACIFGIFLSLTVIVLSFFTFEKG
uniref:MFS transporter n=1 Tax=Thermodesulfobium narugense TaxID=184064 RepID=A0A7C5KAM8_9BACT